MCVGRIKPPSAAVLVQKAREGRVPVPWLVVVEAVGGWWLVVGGWLVLGGGGPGRDTISLCGMERGRLGSRRTGLFGHARRARGYVAWRIRSPGSCADLRIIVNIHRGHEPWLVCMKPAQRRTRVTGSIDISSAAPAGCLVDWLVGWLDAERSTGILPRSSAIFFVFGCQVVLPFYAGTPRPMGIYGLDWKRGSMCVHK